MITKRIENWRPSKTITHRIKSKHELRISYRMEIILNTFSYLKNPFESMDENFKTISKENKA